jgi:hypothetical protein
MKAEWDQIEDNKGRPLYTLRISDGEEVVTASFSPEELVSPTHMRVRLYRLWGDFLQIRNQKQLQALSEGGD